MLAFAYGYVQRGRMTSPSACRGCRTGWRCAPFAFASGYVRRCHVWDGRSCIEKGHGGDVEKFLGCLLLPTLSRVHINCGWALANDYIKDCASLARATAVYHYTLKRPVHHQCDASGL